MALSSSAIVGHLVGYLQKDYLQKDLRKLRMPYQRQWYIYATFLISCIVFGNIIKQNTSAAYTLVAHLDFLPSRRARQTRQLLAARHVHQRRHLVEHVHFSYKVEADRQLASRLLAVLVVQLDNLLRVVRCAQKDEVI